MLYKYKLFLVNLVGLIFFISDRYIKYLLKSRETFYKNKDIAFGLSINNVLLYALIGIILFSLIFLLIRAYQKKDIFFIFSFNLIILGGLSNLLDRYLYGYIVDFINFPYFSIFNIADIMIVGGAILFILHLSRIPRSLLRG